MIFIFNSSLITTISILLLFSITLTFSANAESADNGNDVNEDTKKGDENGNEKNKDDNNKKSKNNISEKSQKKKIEVFDFLKPIKDKDKKINTKISKLITKPQSREESLFEPTTHISEVAKKNGIDYHNGMTRVMINLNELNDTVLDKIMGMATIEVSKGNQMQIIIPTDKISDLSIIPEIKNIKPTLSAIQNRDIIVDGKVFEDSIFSNNRTSGGSVSLAIIDLGFDEKNQKIANNIIESVSFRHIFDTSNTLRGENDEYMHGTAMAQIITSLVPDVKLYLLAAGTELEFIDAMDYAISKNTDIITISYTWVNYDTDGTSPMTKKVENAISSKITVVAPSGNYAENHWTGIFVDTDGDRWHEFTKSDEGMTFNVDYERIYEEKPILVYLKWDDTIESISDFDLTLMDPEGKIVDYSSSTQDQISDDPIEYLYYYPDVPGEYSVGISNFGNSTSAKLEIFSVYDKLEYIQTQGSVGVPSDAKGVVTVGSLGNDSKRQPYSSTGPTDNGLSVPNVLSNDGIITQIYDEPFYGTSSSAAYVSGLIAILYSETQNVDPMNITPMLYDNLLASEFAGKLNTISESPNIGNDYASVEQNTTSSHLPNEFATNNEDDSNTMVCKSNMIMILKKSTQSLACVTKSTAESLIQRGWGLLT